VTTFKRPRAVERLLMSIGRHFPEAAVHIGDQNERLDEELYEELSKRSGLATPPKIHTLEYDCGLAAARNHLVASSSKEFKLILDDDFVFTGETDVEALVRLLDGHPEAGVVGGTLADQDGKRYRVRFDLHRDGATLSQVPSRRPFDSYSGVRYARADFVTNFALIRHEVLRHVAWDPALKLGEHVDFYLQVKETPFTVLFAPDVVIYHLPVEADPDYADFRQRRKFAGEMLQKYGLERLEIGRFGKHRLGTEKLGGGIVVELRSDGSVNTFEEPVSALRQ
jgi:hypothetical protein